MTVPSPSAQALSATLRCAGNRPQTEVSASPGALQPACIGLRYREMDTNAQTALAFLIVEDEPITRMELDDVVRACGFEPYGVGSVSEALQVLETAPQTFAGIITDINLPGTRSGTVLANQVNHVWPHMRIIVLSGGRRPVGGELPHRTPFFSKPASRDALMAAITG